MNNLKLIIYFILYIIIEFSKTQELDTNGYILYCPCMGRFGNQADHFLGALGFAHGLNRTLVLPPWVEYRYGEPKSIQVPFDTYFKEEPLKAYHKVITMEEFMKDIAPIEWPPKARISFCYTNRGDDNSCNAKYGNPFGPFWDTFNVDFVGSEFYGPLHYDTHNSDMVKQWKQKYPSHKWPVLAFAGAPAAFPVQEQNRHLHKYLQWSDTYEQKADDFIETLPKGAFIGIHLRNGIDWVRACEHIPESPSLFAAAQCLGYRNEHGTATADMCLPTKETILRQLKRVIKKLQTIKSVYVASDSNHLIRDLRAGLERIKVDVYKYPENNPHVDLVILGKANHFIGNCISSFSAFVKRERDAKGFTSSFWAFPSEKEKSKRNNISHQEL